MTILSAAEMLRLTDPAVEPITRAEAKAHLRVDGSDEDDLIDALVSAARDRVERFCNRPFVSAGFAMLFEGDLPVGAEPLKVPLVDVTSVVGITYRDAAGAVQTWAEASWSFDAERQELRPATSWPAGSDLRFEAQAGDASTAPVVPPAIRAAMLLYLGDLFELRQAHVVGAPIAVNPAAESLMMPYRVRMGL